MFDKMLVLFTAQKPYCGVIVIIVESKKSRHLILFKKLNISIPCLIKQVCRKVHYVPLIFYFLFLLFITETISPLLDISCKDMKCLTLNCLVLDVYYTINISLPCHENCGALLSS